MSSNNNISLSVVAPAYNEESSIANVVGEWLSILAAEKNAWEIIVTDDGSTDNTGGILRALAQENHHLKVVSLDRNKGCGYALQQAITHARGLHVVTIDADGQFDLAEYEPLLAKLEEGYDIVTGFRHKKIDSPLRVLLDRILHLMVKILFGVSLKDTNCALKIFKREVSEKMQIDSKGYSIPTELLIKAHALGCRIGEVRITHRERLRGESKLRALRVSWQMMLFLLYLKLKLHLFNKGVLNAL